MCFIVCSILFSSRYLVKSFSYNTVLFQTLNIRTLLLDKINTLFVMRLQLFMIMAIVLKHFAWSEPSFVTFDCDLYLYLDFCLRMLDASIRCKNPALIVLLVLLSQCSYLLHRRTLCFDCFTGFIVTM